MGSFLALASVRTESSQVELANDLADMLLATSRTQGAKAFVVVRTRGNLGCGVYMLVEAFITVWTIK